MRKKASWLYQTSSKPRNGKAVNDPASKEMWHRDGHFLKADEPLVQTKLGQLLSAIANDSPAAFYTGDFAQHYVSGAEADGGKITLKDLGKTGRP